jgi:hypothetical protein
VYSGALPWEIEDPLAGDAARLVPWSVSLRWLDDTRIDLAGCLGPVTPRRPDEEDRGAKVHAAFAQLDLSAGPAFDPAQTRTFVEPACTRYEISRDGHLAVYGSMWWRATDSGFRATSGTPPVSLDRPSRRTLDVAVGESWVAQLSASSERGWPYQRDVRLRWHYLDGQALGEIPIGDLASAVFGGRVVPGKLLVLVTEPPNRDAVFQSATQRLLLFDSASGALERLERPELSSGLTLHPIWDEVVFPSRPTWDPEPGSLATQLYFTNDRSLVQLDVGQGVLRLVQAAPGSRNRLADP